MIREMQKKREGFTLIEMIVVIAILGLLMAAVVPGYFAIQRWATGRTTRQALLTLKNSITNYKLMVGSYPRKLEELIEKPSDPRIASKWGGPYLEAETIPLDPWGQEYNYQLTPGGKRPYELYSGGDPDKPGEISAWATE